jgi:hypothetical protein
MRLLFVTVKLFRVGCVPYPCPRCCVEMWRETLETGVSYVSQLPVLHRVELIAPLSLFQALLNLPFLLLGGI